MPLGHEWAFLLVDSSRSFCLKELLISSLLLSAWIFFSVFEVITLGRCYRYPGHQARKVWTSSGS